MFGDFETAVSFYFYFYFSFLEVCLRIDAGEVCGNFFIIVPFSYYILGSLETPGIYLEIHFLTVFVSVLLCFFVLLNCV